MKVLHLWKSDSPTIGGGGAGSMFRLHSNLLKAGIESKILCQEKTTDSPSIAVIPKFMSRTETRIKRFTSRIGLNDIHRLNSLFFSLGQVNCVFESQSIYFP